MISCLVAPGWLPINLLTVTIPVMLLSDRAIIKQSDRARRSCEFGLLIRPLAIIEVSAEMSYEVEHVIGSVEGLSETLGRLVAIC